MAYNIDRSLDYARDDKEDAQGHREAALDHDENAQVHKEDAQDDADML